MKIMPFKIAAVHTASPMIETTKSLAAQYLDTDIKLFNITDDSLIQEVIREDKVTDAVKRRLINYYFCAVDAGADIIFNTCSSVGEVASDSRKIIPIPIVKIDDAMTSNAVSEASRLGVLATLNSTLGPTLRLLESKASEASKIISTVQGLAKGAFDALLEGDSQKHDSLIIDKAKEISGDCEIIVLAQGSMARIQKSIEDATGRKVLSSPVLGILDLKKTIKKIQTESSL
jgi:Asp/Glu/hydantoin racemase